MKKILLPSLLALFMLPLAVMGQCGSNLSVTDADGNSYTSLKIGPHCWLQSNLKTRVPGSSIYWADKYPDTSDNLAVYGRLYSWYAAMNIQPGETPVVNDHGFVQGICPEGWHLPTDAEITQLATYSVPSLHDVHYWLVPGTNTTNYTMRPGGYYNANRNRSEDLCGSSYMWTAQSLDESSPSIVWSDCHCDHFLIDRTSASNGVSVRCVLGIYQAQVATKEADNVKANQADLNGVVIFAGHDENYTRGFIYGTDMEHPSGDTVQTGQSEEGNYSFTINDLAENTTYHFRAYVVNDFDTVYGEWKTFTTPFMEVQTLNQIDDITMHMAKAYGNLTNMGGYESLNTGFLYGTSADALTDTAQREEAITATGNYDCVLNGLLSDTKYYYCAYLTNGRQTVYGDTLDFTTAYMEVETAAATNVTSSSGTLNGTLTALKGYTICGGKFRYGQSEDALDVYTGGSTLDQEGIGFSADLTDLLPNTTYYFQAFAANGTDTVYGEVKNFTTVADIVTDTIVFFANGGIGTMDTMFVTRGDTVLNANTYTHGGNWQFTGWNTEADGSGTQYADQDAITTNGNLTLYAQWHTWCTGIPKTSVNEFGTSHIDSVKDIDNNKYNVVQIGNQCWMAQNLRTTKYADGTAIVKGSAMSRVMPYRYFPGDDTNNVNTYGHLYNWMAVMNGAESSSANPSGVQGICPDGWHVPSNAEWNTLTQYVYNSDDPDYKCSSCESSDWIEATKCIGKALASTTGWKTHTNSCAVGNDLSDNNATGFSAVPAGGITASGKGAFFGQITLFWSATYEATPNKVHARNLYYNNGNVSSSSADDLLGLSVRCLRDPLTVTTDSANTITKDGATLYGNVTSLGTYDQVNAGFKYGTSEDALTTIVAKENAMMAAGQFSYGITGLTANTKCYYKAFAANGTDTVYGEVKNFKTLSINPCPNAATVTDVDNNVYNTVQIGNQCWMAENLRTTKYANGTAIANGGTTPSITTAYRYFPGGDTNNVATYGHLYNWKAVMGTSTSSKANPSGVQGICPDGWHVPSDAEWTQLTAYVKSQSGYKCNVSPDNIAKALASATGWCGSPDYCDVGNDQSSNNATGFSAVPAGSYNGSRSGFDGVGGNAYFWSATRRRIYAYYRSINYSDEYVTCDDHFRDNGYSVRCLRDPLTVVTTAVSSITANSAICGGNVLADGGSAVTARGVCWSTSQNPTTADGHTTDGSGTGSFNSSITGLSGSTTYYVRAYATNGEGTAYGSQVSFTTNTSFTCGTDSVKDIDNNWYHTVQIGDQCWMKENLRTNVGGGVYPKYPSGHTREGQMVDDSLLYGRLYTWDAMMNGSPSSETAPSGVQGICPAGWHVPSNAEWDTLTKFVFSIEDYKCGEDCGEWAAQSNVNCIAKALASTMGWSESTNTCAIGNSPEDNNKTGFSAVPAGNVMDSDHDGFSSDNKIWSATQYNSEEAYRLTLDNNSTETYLSSDNKYDFFNSVRCVRDDMSVTTNSATTVTKDGATLYGNVTSLGTYDQVNAGFKYGTSESTLTSIASDGSAMYATGRFSYTITGLTANTQYYYKAFAANGTDTVYGEVKNFKTLSINPCPNAATVTDVDNNVYNTVQIGNQCWMAENLRTTKYANGIAIEVGTSTSTTIPYRYAPNRNESNVATYGYLYNWVAVMNGASSSDANPSGVQGICPTGWHVPSDAEWTQLTNYVSSQSQYVCDNDNNNNIAKALASTTGWNSSTETCAVGNIPDNNNKTGFSALPAGGVYGNFGNGAYVWSATEGSSTGAYYRNLYYKYAYVNRTNNGNKGVAFSVRCLRDAEVPAAMSVTTDSANTITKDGATLYGNVTSLGTYNQVNAGFKYGTSEDALTTIVSDESAMTAAGQFSFGITGLTANTQYYYKAFAANGSDTVYGEVKNFTTLTDVVTDTIVFFANGGIGTMDTMFVTRGDTVLNANTYTHGGNWQFTGWNTEADGSGTQYADQDAITTNGNLTLYAQWHTWCTGIPKTSVNEFGTSRIDSVKDIDNNKYNVVQIGDQCWMAQNLRTTKYADGTSISLGSTTSTETAYHYYPTGSSSNVSKYGYLYNWKAVMGNSTSSETNPSGVQGICPKGWHVPSDTEWTQLTNYVSSQSEYVCESINTYNAKALASTTGWNSSSNTCVPGNNPSDNNATGFSAVPAGYYSGGYGSFGDDAHFWSATQYYNSYAYSRYVDYNYADVHKYNYEEYYGFSVRCLRDPMTVTTDSANTITKNSATLYGNVTDMGGKSEVNAGFKYGTSEDALTTIVAKEDATTAPGMFSYGITGLTANTQYYYKAFAANGTDTVYGEVKNFTTLSINPCPNAATVTDVDGNEYNTVQIGSQCWMKENLRTTKYADGTPISLGNSKSTSTAYRYYPNNDSNTVSTYGYLYNWRAAMRYSSSSENNPSGVQGICPTGWHLPSDAEWTQLTDYVSSQSQYRCNGNASFISKSLAATSGWRRDDFACAIGNYQFLNNATDFSGVPSGDYSGDYALFASSAYFWSTTLNFNDSNSAYIRLLYYNSESVSRNYNPIDFGFGVRCLRN